MFSHRDLARLNDLEMQVYQFIIKHREGVSYMTIRELAEQAGVSTTTVLRFCRKMHCEGWSEFRIRLRLAEQQHTPQLNTAGVSEMLSFFNSINNPAFEQLIAQAAQKIAQAEQVFLLASAHQAAWRNMVPAFSLTSVNSVTQLMIPITRSVPTSIRTRLRLFYPSPVKPKRSCVLPASSA